MSPADRISPVDRMSSADQAADAVAELRRRGWTVAVAESLTGGLLGAALTAVPGSSAVFRGGVTAYATSLKHDLLGVPADLLATAGPVAARTARMMANGVRDRLGADVGMATTGVAGPGPADGHPAGEVYVACAWPAGTAVDALLLSGGREQVRLGSVRCALDLLQRVVALQQEARTRWGGPGAGRAG